MLKLLEELTIKMNVCFNEVSFRKAMCLWFRAQDNSGILRSVNAGDIADSLSTRPIKTIEVLILDF
jgi:hypothetical protein